MLKKYRKVTEFKNINDFRNYLKEENIPIEMVDEVPTLSDSAMGQKIEVYGKTLGNRWAILPMEGWDCSADGKPSEYTRRRWLRFAISGAKLLYGTEAAAVMHTGRSNPRQLLCNEETKESLTKLCAEMKEIHKDKFGRNDDFMIGLQLTHSGRYSHPNESHILESKTAYSHPLLDVKYNNSPANVVSDEEVEDIVAHFIKAAKVAEEAGFDFVDIKLAHGYLGHEFLSAHDRKGKYGGSFENRTRFVREIYEGIKQNSPNLKLSSRLSIFDIFPFVKGEDSVGIPMKWDKDVYPYAFGGDGSGMEMDYQLEEVVKLVDMLKGYGVELICATIGSPYYNVHMQRPAYYPVCDGYEMPEHPLYNVYRHILAVKRLKELCPDIKLVGSGYTCLQEYLANVAEYAVENNYTDFVGIGRMVLSYPEFCHDSLEGKELNRRCICRTFGDCTTAPRNGIISGCYPLDNFYKELPEALKLKFIKNSTK